MPSRSEAMLDRAEVLRHVGGDEELLREMVQVFLDECPRLVADVREGITRGDGVKLKRSAHKLRGALSIFGVPETCAAVEQLETLGRAADLANAQPILAAVEAHINQLLPALPGLISPPAP